MIIALAAVILQVRLASAPGFQWETVAAFAAVLLGCVTGYCGWVLTFGDEYP